MKDRLLKKERNLIIRSEAIKEYPWLLQLIDEKESVKIEDVPSDKMSDFKYVLPHILKVCGDEWMGDESLLHPVEDLGEKRRKCGLCGTPNRYIYYIKNRLNNNKLNVGKDCVEEFVDLDLLREGKTKGQLLKKAQELRRMGTINKKFPGIERIISDWLSRTEKYEIVLPSSMEEPYNRNGQLLNDLYRNYLKGDEIEQSLEEIEALIKSESSTIKMFEQYQKENENMPFIATKKMIRWLQDKKDKKSEEILREHGSVTLESVPHIWEKEYIEKNKHIVEGMFKSAGLIFINADHEENGYTYKKENSNFIMILTFHKFYYHFGAYVLGLEEKSLAPFNQINVIRISDIVKNYINILYFIEEMSLVMQEWDIDYEIEEEDIDADAAYVWDKNVGAYVKLSLSKLIFLIKGKVLGLAKPTQANFELSISQEQGRRYTKRELQENREILNSMTRRERQ
ncbi:hypothetical protein [Paenibacillus sp. RC21]|uniref:hypothetical protein n=1 Tax=Paenibacillus sp. RC21 TaxID=3156312 RepID=UPI003833D506